MLEKLEESCKSRNLWSLKEESEKKFRKAARFLGSLANQIISNQTGVDIASAVSDSATNSSASTAEIAEIKALITNLIEGKKVPIYGTGENVRDWLHVDDHCRGIYSVLMNGRSGEAYNIGGGRELSNNEITSLILEAMDADESSIEYVEDRKGHDLRYSVDWTKINRELGYEPKIKFEDGLKETIQWYRDNEAWWKPLKNR